MRRPPSRTHGILPAVRQLNNVRRLIGNFASSCFSLIKFGSPRTPFSSVSKLAGCIRLAFRKSFCSLFMIFSPVHSEENLHRPGQVLVYHRHRLSGAGDTLAQHRKCPFNVSNRIRKAIQSAPVEPAARWQSHGMNLPVLDGGTPYPSSRRGFRVRKTVTADSQNIRVIGPHCGHCQGQSTDTNWPHTGHGQDSSASTSRPRPRSIRAMAMSVICPCP
jgi:hypothetical protein